MDFFWGNDDVPETNQQRKRRTALEWLGFTSKEKDEQKSTKHAAEIPKKANTKTRLSVCIGKKITPKPQKRHTRRPSGTADSDEVMKLDEEDESFDNKIQNKRHSKVLADALEQTVRECSDNGGDRSLWQQLNQEGVDQYSFNRKQEHLARAAEMSPRSPKSRKKSKVLDGGEEMSPRSPRSRRNSRGAPEQYSACSSRASSRQSCGGDSSDDSDASSWRGYSRQGFVPQSLAEALAEKAVRGEKSERRSRKGGRSRGKRVEEDQVCLAYHLD